MCVVNDVCLKKLAVHMEELEQKVLVKSECDLAFADFINHHEGDLIFLFLVSVIYHVHIDNIVLNNDVVAVRVELWHVLALPSPNFNIDITFLNATTCLNSFVSLVLKTETEHNIEDTCAKIKISQTPDQFFKLGLIAHFESIV